MVTWRTGRKVGRTIYAMEGAEPSDADVLIGMMDSPELAEQAVAGRNEVERAWGVVRRLNRRVGPYFIGQWAAEIVHIDPCDCDLDEEEAGDRCMEASEWVYGVFVDGGAFAPRLVASLPRKVLGQEDVVHVGLIHEAAHAVVDTFTTADPDFMAAHADAVAALAKAIDMDLDNMWERS